MYIVEIGNVRVQVENLDTARELILTLAKIKGKGRSNSQAYDRKLERNLVKNISSPEEIPGLISKIGHGVHTVYSGLNDRLRQLGYNPIDVISNLVRSGKINARPAKGGYIIFN